MLNNKWKLSVAALLSLLLQGCNYTVTNQSASSVSQLETPFDIVNKADFNTTVRPLLLSHCAACHATIQEPFHSSPDLNTGYGAVVNNALVDLTTLTNSRFYTRLATDQHNCWTDCATAAQTMLAALQAWQQLNATTPLPNDPTRTVGPAATIPATLTATPANLSLATTATQMKFTMMNPTQGPVTFTVSIEQYNATNYRLFWPTVTAPSGYSIHLQDIQFQMNGATVQNSSFSYIFRQVTGQGQSVPVVLDSTLTMIIPVEKGAGIDQLAPSFATFTSP